MSSPARGLYGSEVGANMARAGAAEIVGTFLLVFAGTAVAVSGALGRAIAGPAADSLAVALAFGLVLVALVSALGHVSGAHFNPAVTVALAATGKFPWRYAPVYVLAQLLGAVLAAFAVWGVYGDRARADAALGATAPATGASTIQVVLVEVLITFLLVLVIISVATDDRVAPAAVGPAVGFALAAAVLIGGPVSGGAVNPARALGPMLVSGSLNGWWIYLLAPVAGALIAAVIYDRFLAQASAPEPEPEPDTDTDTDTSDAPTAGSSNGSPATGSPLGGGTAVPGSSTGPTAGPSAGPTAGAARG